MNFIDAGKVSPERSVELDREAFAKGDEILIVYSRDGPTVSLGRFSSLDSIDCDFAKANNISIVRRISGGSAIFSDENQMTITMIADRKRFTDKEEAYSFFGECIVKALSTLGIDAQYKPVNDILLNGRKISGSAQYRNEYTVMVHGSLILGLDERFLKVLRPLKEIKHPVSSIEKECGLIPKRKELSDALETAFDQ